MTENHSCCNTKQKPWYKEPLYIILFFLFSLVVINILINYFGITILNPALFKFWDYIKITWWAILLGILIGGIIDALVPPQLMIKFLNKGKKSIVFAVLFGFLASACSHGILAIAVSLYKKGASTAATLAFLLAAPWANVAITILLFSLFGIKALFIIFGAIFTAVVCGFIFQILEKRGIIEGGNRKILETESNKIHWIFPGWNNLLSHIYHHSWYLTKMVMWWVILGFLIASALGTYLPDSFFHNYFGPSIIGLLATLAIATIIEVCSEGSAPMAFELFNKTRAFGNSFVFLQAGVVTDFTEIGVISTNIGKRAAIALVLTGTPLILVLGFLFNYFL